MQCRFCSKEISQKGSLAAHEKGCTQNPHRVKQTRSPRAGRQKGCEAPNKGKTNKYTMESWTTKIPNDKIFVENSETTRKVIRKRILNYGLLEYRCQICGIGPEWCGKPMPLVLDHINGVNNDHRLENLRFVCSNCDTQLETYKAKNKRKHD